jgi:uncharacterized membrane protein
MDEGYSVVVGVFRDEATASEVYKTLKHTSNTDWLRDLAVVVRDGGKIKLKESEDMGGREGLAWGGAIGALVGLFAGPLGWAAVGGALVGGLIAKLRDVHLPNQSLKRLGEGLEAGQAAIVALVRADLVDRTARDLRDMGAEVTTEGLDSETVERLTAAQEESRSQKGTDQP